ncbi:hypothetical protein DI270_028155 [Microbispora triticiradicis]|uniref:DUF308 domain-containing protein n=3 Tax=Microbispora TaxID=2005 RepID=A0ABY3LY19_9ACTN|nr:MULTISPECIES: hypothetical protein [Microbispora]RGA01750.1 hypothetical protein DI270_028155 [Microbispora triticiradicis]TLP53190.1 hypothetical protein FED44_30455 [Microbispora fusca]TYB59348.1 hypothetical protein FXF59_15215 [Microbispora tritici]
MTPQSDEDEVWRQIVASFNEKAEDASADQPWPDRENVTEEPRPGAANGSTATDRDGADDGARDTGGERDDAAGEDTDEPDGQTAPVAVSEDDDHYVPPPPPPLPQADAVTRASWLALFGGPAYLLLAALLDWPRDGWIVFAAVSAFIAGFVVLVVRMGDGPPTDSGWDDGAVV